MIKNYNNKNYMNLLLVKDLKTILKMTCDNS